MALTWEAQQNYERWRKDGLLNIKPDSLRFGQFPEGWDVIAALKRHVASLPHDRIVDFGCGYGRLCKAFGPEKYVGVDINESAVEVARADYPDYVFQTASYVDQYPHADIYLAYTVFLHVPHPDLNAILGKMCQAARWIVIAEILPDKEHYKDPDDGKGCRFQPHAVYHRTKQEYEKLLAPFEFTCWEEVRKRYCFYREAEISILIFHRRNPPPDRIDLPDALRDGELQFEGIYEDGWAGQVFAVRLSRLAQARSLRIDGMLPSIDPEVSGCRLSVLIEGQQEHTVDIPVGHVEAEIPVHTDILRPWIRIRCSTVQLLPLPDSRTVSLLLTSLGYVDSLPI